MKRWMAMVLALSVLCMCLLAGCAKTPDVDVTATTTTVAGDSGGTTDAGGSNDVSTDGTTVAGGSGDNQTTSGNGGNAVVPTGPGSVNKANVLDDELNDMSKLYEYGSQYKLDSLYDYFFENDSSRVIPAKSNSKDTWLTYKFDNIQEFEVVTYRY